MHVYSEIHCIVRRKRSKILCAFRLYFSFDVIVTALRRVQCYLREFYVCVTLWYKIFVFYDQINFCLKQKTKTDERCSYKRTNYSCRRHINFFCLIDDIVAQFSFIFIHYVYNRVFKKKFFKKKLKRQRYVISHLYALMKRPISALVTYVTYALLRTLLYMSCRPKNYSTDLVGSLTVCCYRCRVCLDNGSNAIRKAELLFRRC